MAKNVFYNKHLRSIAVLLLALIALASCQSIKHLPEGKYLLWKNKVELRNQEVMVNKGELRENLDNLIIQQPNSNFMGLSVVRIPWKLGRYNLRYRKFGSRPDSLLPKTLERPVIFDSLTMPRSIQNMKNYMFNQGYFYARVWDTVTFRGRKAVTKYVVDAGPNYIINHINYNINDSEIAAIVISNEFATILKKGKEFTYSMLEEERSRITALINNHGYRRFSLENITFKIDTLDKSIFKVAASPFENAVNFIAQSKSNKKSTLDVDIIIRKADDTLSYNKYTISKITVFPDYRGPDDRTDPDMIVRNVNGVEFRYHNMYVLPRVLYRHMFIAPGKLYSKADEDRTISRIGGLGIFHYIRMQFRENRVTRDSVDCSVFLSRAQKYDFSTNFEVSNSSTYFLGNSLNVNFRNKNFLKGANLLTVSANGGVETSYNENIDGNIYKRVQLLTWFYGVNASLDFPKFLAPVASSIFSSSNLPHTVITVGENVLDRVNYFKLINTSANFSYNWRETDTKTWTLTPAFINNIRLPVRSKDFDELLSKNEYLKNSYKSTFIEGESISFRFDNSQQQKKKNYSYLRLAFEEAGSVMRGLKKAGFALNQLYDLEDTIFAQYMKFDFDARHYFSLRRSVLAFRFYGGVGVPYGGSVTMPYIKQYFAGGPYSLRGWRIRTLGPGRLVGSADSGVTIDRTGDIKLEMNGEYRFPVMPLFAGAVKMNGAVFADAGNIWLTYADATVPGGEFTLGQLGSDIAMDVGIGARFEIASFLTIRFDLAMPVKQPNVLTNNGWVTDQINFKDKNWRSLNLIPNFSIGYPF